MISIPSLLAVTQVVLGPPLGGDGPIAFNCSLRDVTVEATTGVNAVHQVSVLASVQRGSGRILETFDPGNVLKGANLSTVVSMLNPVSRDSYIFVLGTPDKVANEVTMLVRRDRDEVTGALKPEYIGIMAPRGPKNHTHLGFCEILGGEKATELFKSIDSWKAQGK